MRKALLTLTLLSAPAAVGAFNPERVPLIVLFHRSERFFHHAGVAGLSIDFAGRGSVADLHLRASVGER